MSHEPYITEDYQRKLQSFLSSLPPLGSEIQSGTPVLKYPFTKRDLDAHKGQFVTNPLFKKYTGWDHESLLRKWLVDTTTTCNEFCTKCAIAMGVGKGKTVGRFDIADWLTTRGLGHVWVPADSGATPEYGDIYRLLGSKPDANGVRRNHMAVSLYLDGSTWYTAESGQGGPSSGCDRIMRRKDRWKPPSLRGWVSMKALLNSNEPLPFWLGGWWEVHEEPYSTYFYHFAANGKVTCTTHRPVSVTAPPITSSLVGTFSSKRMFEVNISWHSADVDETITCYGSLKKREYKLIGKTARGLKLTGQRLMLKNRFG